MQKVDGVRTATVSLKAGMTTVELRPDNSVTLAQLRNVIKNNGFVSKEADVMARGRLSDGQFEVAGTHERLPVLRAPTTANGVATFTVPAR